VVFGRLAAQPVVRLVSHPHEHQGSHYRQDDQVGCHSPTFAPHPALPGNRPHVAVTSRSSARIETYPPMACTSGLGVRYDHIASGHDRSPAVKVQ
jgi:hypothetical protein